MATELKSGIWIEGFDKMSSMYDKILTFGGANNVLYKGKTALITEERARVCVSYHLSDETVLYYKDYSKVGDTVFFHNTAKKSIESACSQEYCIIYRII